MGTSPLFCHLQYKGGKNAVCGQRLQHSCLQGRVVGGVMQFSEQERWAGQQATQAVCHLPRLRFLSGAIWRQLCAACHPQ